MPVEPPPSRWQLPSTLTGGDLVGFGADLEPGTLLAAYRNGMFPMPIDRHVDHATDIAWWSPEPRGVLPLTGLRVPRSLRQARRRFTIRIDTAFDQVITACAEPSRPGAWIGAEIIAAYQRLHQLGWAHSVEAWTPDGRLAGGLYGVAIGGLFAGESMFHAPRPWGRDASKVALAALIDHLRADDGVGRLLDVQWATPHLVRLGVVEIPRAEYLTRLRRALELPLPQVFAGVADGEAE